LIIIAKKLFDVWANLVNTIRPVFNKQVLKTHRINIQQGGRCGVNIQKKIQDKLVVTFLIIIVCICFFCTEFLLPLFSRTPDVIADTQNSFTVIDVSEKNDNGKFVFDIKNNWDFYPNKLIFSEDFKKNTYQESSASEESYWSESNPQEKQATYRLLAKKDNDKRFWALYFKNVETSYEVFIDGEKISSVVSFSETQDYYPKYRIPRGFHFFSTEEEYFEIILHVKNNSYSSGGLNSTVVLGTSENVSLIRNFYGFIDGLFVANFTVGFIFLLHVAVAKKKFNHLKYLIRYNVMSFFLLLLNPNFSIFSIYYLIPYSFSIRLIFLFNGISTLLLFRYLLKQIKDSKFILVYKVVQFFYMAILLVALVLNTKFIYVLDYCLIVSANISIIILFYATISASLKKVKKSIPEFFFFIMFIFLHIVDISYLKVSYYKLFIYIGLMWLLIYREISKTFRMKNKFSKINISLEEQLHTSTKEIVRLNELLREEAGKRIYFEQEKYNFSDLDNSKKVFTYSYSKTYIEDLLSLYDRHKDSSSIIIFEVVEKENIIKLFGKAIYEKAVWETMELIKMDLRRTDMLSSYVKDNQFLIIMPHCSGESCVSVKNKIDASISNNVIEDVGLLKVNYGFTSVVNDDNVSSLFKRLDDDLGKNLI